MDTASQPRMRHTSCGHRAGLHCYTAGELLHSYTLVTSQQYQHHRSDRMLSKWVNRILSSYVMFKCKLYPWCLCPAPAEIKCLHLLPRVPASRVCRGTRCAQSCTLPHRVRIFLQYRQYRLGDACEQYLYQQNAVTGDPTPSELYCTGCVILSTHHRLVATLSPLRWSLWQITR